MEDQELNQDTLQETEVEQPQHSEVELRAMEMGWRPKEEFHGDENDFIDAKEFVRRKPLFDKIEHQGKQIKAVTKALEALKTHYTRVEEAAVQKAINQMKQQRKQALADGDGDAFEAYDDEIKKAENSLAQIERAKEVPLVEDEVVNPEWSAWQSRNSWYNSAPHMKIFADQVGQELAQRGMAPADVLKEVEKAVRKEFPNKFTNPNKAGAPDVDSSRAGNTSPKKGNDEAKLDEQQRKIMNDLVRQKVLTKEQYIADLKEAGLLK